MYRGTTAAWRDPPARCGPRLVLCGAPRNGRESRVSETRAGRAKVFDDIFLAYERSARLPALMRLALDETLPPEVEPYSFVTVPALHEIARELQLTARELLVDLGCGRGGPGIWVAQK